MVETCFNSVPCLKCFHFQNKSIWIREILQSDSITRTCFCGFQFFCTPPIFLIQQRIRLSFPICTKSYCNTFQTGDGSTYLIGSTYLLFGSRCISTCLHGFLLFKTLVSELIKSLSNIYIMIAHPQRHFNYSIINALSSMHNSRSKIASSYWLYLLHPL